MDATIPTAIGQWLMDTAGTILTWPGPYGWGIITGWAGPNALSWASKKVGKKRR